MNNGIEKIKLKSLGFNEFFEFNQEEIKLENYFVARVIVEHKGVYKVRGETGECLARITGKQIINAKSRKDYPAVGDWVIITKSDKEQAIIHKILPRKTILRKKYSNKQEDQIIATNIDVAFVVESVDRDYNFNRFERFFVLANDGGIKPVIILNKIDLIPDAELKARVDQIKDRFKGIDFILTSVVANEGMGELKKYTEEGKTYCFLGSSGVGKSSLINKLIGKNDIKTREISQRTGRGKHTTTNREMYFLENGGVLIDNPGTREVGVVDSDVGINSVFIEIAVLSKKCKYADCTHVHEAGCAVLNALEKKELDENRYSNYVRLKKEVEHYRMTEFERKKKDRKFGKFVKKSLKQLKKIKSK